jgi:hypothetical protein
MAAAVMRTFGSVWEARLSQVAAIAPEGSPTAARAINRVRSMAAETSTAAQGKS